MTGPDVPLLADLDAGLLDPDHAQEVRRAAEADPRSAEVLDALAATRADLAAVPAPVAPPDLVAGWLAALDAACGPAVDRRRSGSPGPDPGDTDPGGTDPGDRPEADPVSRAPAHPGPTPIDPVPIDPVPGGPASDGHRSGRGPRPARSGRGPAGRRAGAAGRRRWALAGGATALVVGLLVLFPAAVPEVTGVGLAAVARSTVGTTDLGEFTDPARRDGCLAAAGHPGTQVFGGRRVRWEGRPGVLLVLSTGERGVVRALVVTPDCTVLADETVGR